MENRRESKLLKRLDLSTMVIPLIAIVLLCAVFMLLPEQSKNVLGVIRSFMGDDIGVYYVLLGVRQLFVLCIWHFPNMGRSNLEIWRSRNTVPLNGEQ